MLSLRYLPTLFRQWRRERSIRQRTHIYHTMDGVSLKRTQLGLELVVEGLISTTGSLEMSRDTLHNINKVLEFYVVDLMGVKGGDWRPRILPEELKEDYDVTTIWLDRFLLYGYPDTHVGFNETIKALNSIHDMTSTLSPGLCDSYTRKCRTILKQLNIIVEHYL